MGLLDIHWSVTCLSWTVSPDPSLIQPVRHQKALAIETDKAMNGGDSNRLRARTRGGW